MSEIKVNKEKALAKSETAESFAPLIPFRKFFALTPFGLMREFSDEMDRMMRGVTVDGGVWSPVIDIEQTDGTLLVTAELPGLKKEEVKVELTDEALIIEGERKQEHKEEKEGYHRWERSYGQFYRSIPLPEGAKTDQAKAELSEGVLKISLPVAETKKKVREVAIEEGAKPKVAA